MVLTDDITKLKGIGKKTSALFNRVGVFSLWDLLMYIPRGFETLPEYTVIRDSKDKEKAALLLTICSAPTVNRMKRVSILSCMAEDREGAKIKLIWFNSPYLKNMLRPGMTKVFYGRRGSFKEMPTLEMPKFYPLQEYESLQGVMEPKYPLTKGLTSNAIQKAVGQALESVEIKDFLSDEDFKKLKLMDLKTAVRTLHYPSGTGDEVNARKRIAFNEFLIFLLNVKKCREIRENKRSSSSLGMTETKESYDPYVVMETAAAERVKETLPYALTEEQEKAYKEIMKDMSSGIEMNRLLQGDTGSGKTIVAFLAMISAADNGYQAAIMAPTEVLAAQHMEKLKELIKNAGLPYEAVLLTGSLTAKEKAEARRKIESKEALLIVGTHALIQEGVNFKDLALAVTDEQHRFGVKQREKLSGPEERGAHVLVMSATPIPRTLGIILYGDLDISLITKKPAKRKEIKNCVVGPDYRKTAYSFIKKEIDKGHQAYVICPMVEGSEEMSDYENVADYSEKLREIYGDTVRIGTLNGRMKSKEKVETMDRFSSGDYDILVSTTVVEVGVDVPNATVMMIENAERFGLASLHQIRGRVGRGEDQGYCIFLDTSGDEKENKRLKILNESNDGFEIADEDLKMRGPGDFFGIRQSGEMDFRLADIYSDADMLRLAASYSSDIDDDTLKKLQGYMKYEKRFIL